MKFGAAFEVVLKPRERVALALADGLLVLLNWGYLMRIGA